MNVLMFPGQGAQFVGMGRELHDRFPAARATFAEADEVLGYPLSEICFAGPAERLTQTDVCQPALVTVSVAAWRVAAEHGLTGDLVMGHSLGEYSALVAAEAIGFADAVRLVAERGAAMQAAADARPGTMAAVLGSGDEEVAALCDRAGDVWPANFNCPGQVVVSGTAEGVDRLLGLVAEAGGRATRLQVAGAFHSPLMAPAADRLAPALAAWEPAPPAIPFLSTTTAEREGAERMREILLTQLTAPVRFGAAVAHALEAGGTRFVELGPGRVLSGLVKRVRRDTDTVQIGTPGDLGVLVEG
ncbi:MAG TPA: ACP S-malonyltransferase [Miltoncostaeaceae bacterium]|nr:ACP S-malonyltransferase [Miltoncostaeaceae bacterium]